MTPVTTFTEDAAAAEAADTTDYKEILEELMEGRTLRQFAEQAGIFSHTLWAAMRSGEKPIHRVAKDRLRKMVKLPPLPPLPVEAVADMDPNAAVWTVGQQPPNALLLWNVEESPEMASSWNRGMNVRDSPVNTVTAPCNLVTRHPRKHAKRYIRAWHELPTETLAKCVKERYEIWQLEY